MCKYRPVRTLAPELELTIAEGLFVWFILKE